MTSSAVMKFNHFRSIIQLILSNSFTFFISSNIYYTTNPYFFV